MTPGEGSLPVVIRAATPRDLPGLVQMCRGGVRLDLPETVLNAYTPLKGLAPNRWLPFAQRRRRVRTYLARCSGIPCALVQARDGVTPEKWEILYLGATEQGSTPFDAGRINLWTALLDYTTAAAGRRGAQRLYAKLPSDTQAIAAFRGAGYTRYGAEMLYLLSRGTEVATPDSDDTTVTLRPQTSSDTWALHQLYTLTAPKPVQYAEAYTSDHWELPKRWLLPAQRGGLSEWGFLVERGHELAVYCRVVRQGQRARLEFMYEPHCRELLAPTLQALLDWLTPGPDQRVYCLVREFQHDLAGLLEARAGVMLGEQDLLVRYTTVAVRARRTLIRPALEREPASVGVPAI